MPEKRTSTVERTTGETSIEATFCLDGTGQADVSTGVGFLDHMLELFARHGLFDLTVRAEGDLEVDSHHTTEDVGIVLGQAFDEALGDKKGITRFADVRLPMQESLAEVAVDVCGRAFLHCQMEFPTERVGEFDLELVEEFLHAFAGNSALTLHVDLVRCENSHHGAEAIYKGLARALRTAVSFDPRAAAEVPSTKGTL